MIGSQIEVKSPDQLRSMERAGHIVEGMLAAVRAEIAPGVSTKKLDDVAYAYVMDHGATPNFLGYYGYPATICTSVNDQVVHGIPGDDIIRDGDVVSVDGGCFVKDDAGDQWHGDSAFTVVVGEGTDRDRGLCDATEKALWSALAALAVNDRVGAVGRAVEDVVAEHLSTTGQRLSIVEEFVGHGIGSKMHMSPNVLNYATRSRGMRLRPGMAIAVEPILAAGNPTTRVLDDEWTAVTLDGSRAAHWEHSVAFVKGGIRVLTASDGGAAGLAPYGITPAPIA